MTRSPVATSVSRSPYRRHRRRRARQSATTTPVSVENTRVRRNSRKSCHSRSQTRPRAVPAVRCQQSLYLPIDLVPDGFHATQVCPRGRRPVISRPSGSSATLCTGSVAASTSPVRVPANTKLSGIRTNFVGNRHQPLRVARVDGVADVFCWKNEALGMITPLRTPQMRAMHSSTSSWPAWTPAATTMPGMSMSSLWRR